MADVAVRRYQRLPRLSGPDGAGQGDEAFLRNLHVGQRLAVRFADEPGLMMERMLLWQAGPPDSGMWAILTPDLDVYPENMLATTPADGPDRVAYLGPACIAPGAWRGSFYRFRVVPTEAEQINYIRIGREELGASGYVLAREPAEYVTVHGEMKPWIALFDEVPGVTPPTDRVAIVSLDQDDAPRGDLDPGPGFVWIVAEAGAKIAGGTVVELAPGDTRVGDRGLHTTDEGDIVCVKRVASGDVDKESLLLLEDARLLGHLRYDSEGRRGISFAQGVQELREEPAPDFPLDGARSARWLMKYIVEHGATPDGRQTKWASEQKIDKDAAGYHIHDMLGLALQVAITYDQLDVSNLASMEVIARLYQIIEETGGNMRVEGLEHYVGRGAAGSLRRGVALAPMLAKHTTEQLAQQTSILKERRKAREEAASAKAQAKKPAP